MKRKRHTPEQVIRKLREADAELSAGKGIAAVCQKLEVNFDPWKSLDIAYPYLYRTCAAESTRDSGS